VRREEIQSLGGSDGLCATDPLSSAPFSCRLLSPLAFLVRIWLATTHAAPATVPLLALVCVEQGLYAGHDQVRLRLRNHVSTLLGDDERSVIDRIGEKLM
jgi:hypothetical protein